MLSILVAAISAMWACSGCGELFAIDECDPSENLELFEMTTEELDDLCGEDRDFIMGDE